MIETAFVAPVLVMMALGSFDASRMVARQAELQSAAAEAASIVQTSPPQDAAARDTIRNVLKASTGLDDEHVVVAEIYRCDSDPAYVLTKTCAATSHVSTFVRVTLTDSYSPVWTNFGVGSALQYDVVRTVQVS